MKHGTVIEVSTREFDGARGLGREKVRYLGQEVKKKKEE